MRPAVAFSTSIISASSECDAPGLRCRRVSTSHCPRVIPSRRTRRSNSVRSRRATSEITTPMYSSVFGMAGHCSRGAIGKLGYIIVSKVIIGSRDAATEAEGAEFKRDLGLSTAEIDADEAAGFMPPAQRYLTMATVVLGSSLYGTALLTTSTILPQMQGALSATQDEIAWVMTFNILATAVVTPMTGWLVSRFGTRRVVVYSIGLFTLSTLLCGMAQSLDVLVLWRILQGGTGAPIVPLSQSILFNTFPRRQHTMVMSVFGMAVAVAPAFGPVIGGYLAEMYSWRWSFYMLVPIGICATIGMAWTLPPDNRTAKVRFDWTGFIALATALAAVQLVLARGVRLDWFDSMEIVIECLIAGLAFYIFMVHSLSAREPFLNLQLLADRNYAIGLALVTIYGMLNFTPMV